MDDNILDSLKHLKEKEIKFQIGRFSYKYDFIYVFNNFKISENENTYKNINESNAILIDQIINDQCFIVCFKNTIILIESKHISYLNDLFSSNKQITFYFGTKSKSIFDQICKMQVKKSDSFINVAENDDSLQNNIRMKFNKKSPFINLWSKIKNLISKYLIHESYFKSLVNRFRKNNKSSTIDINKNDCINIEMIGAGASSLVYLVYYIKDQIFLAMKVMQDKKKEYLLERENKNYSVLKHPLIPNFIGRIEDFNTFSNVFEYINGQTLEKSILNNRISGIDDKIYIIIQIMLVIEFFHLKKFLVCDLKPDNIKITEDKTVVFIDLDHAISQDDLLQFEYHSNDFPTDFVCSEFNSDYFSNESDIVSLGNLIYFIMNGENPKNNDFIHINRSDKYNMYLAQIYNMCIKKNKKNRPSISKLINLLFLSFPNIIENNNIKYLVEINAQIIREMNNIDENDEYLKKCINSVEIRCINNKNDLSRMIEYYSKNINKEDQNNSEEMIILGLIHLNDIIIKQNINEALRNIEQAAKLNNQTAQVVVHNLYTNEIVIEKNINKALKYLSYAANNGNSIAQELMGNYYLEGKYIEQNIPKSLHYFSCSANQNNFISQKIMAIFYINGKYIKRDLNKAIAYLKLSADQNDSEAKLILACFFKKTETYETETYETYFSNFCNMLNMDFSSINFKEQIEIFKSIPKNDQVSIQYLNDATNQCLKEAQFLYGLMDIENNFDKSMHYLKLSADQNYSPAQYLLGNIYYSKTPKEVDNAVCYFKLASNQGHTDAQLCLGLIILIEKNDIKEGIKYIEMAAKKNNSIAQCLIGLYYTQFNADQNDIIIMQKLQSFDFCFMLMMCNDNINNELGIRYLTSSAKQNNELAQIFLGIIYSSNPFFVKDFDKSLYYFHLASKKNSEAKIIYDLLDAKNDAKKILLQ